MRISALIATHQRRHLVFGAIDSALTQERAPDEVIIVDDGSTDGTAEAIHRRYGERVRLMRQEHRGLSAARNAAALEATGDLLAFVDDDDRWLPHHLTTIAALAASQPRAVLFSTFYGGKSGTDGPDDAICADFSEALLLEQDWVGPPTAVAVRRDAYDAVGGCDERVHFCEDWDLYVRLSLLGPMAVISARTIERRELPDSLWAQALRSGRQPELGRLVASKVLVSLARSTRSDAPALRRAAAARFSLEDALSGLATGASASAIRPHLANVCQFGESLRQDPSPIAYQLPYAVLEWTRPARRLRTISTLLAAWPHPVSLSYLRLLRACARNARRPPPRAGLAPGPPAEGRDAFFDSAVRPSPRAQAGDGPAAEPDGPTPTVSVVLATHQRCDAVRVAVASVLAQTFRDFELIVVDDGSTDGTGEAIASLQPLIRYVRQPNRGVAAARNAGIRLARGPIIAFIDSDDVWLPEHLEVIVALFAAHPEAVLASTSPGYASGGRAPLERSRYERAFPAILTRAIAGFVSSTAVKRQHLEALGGFDESFEALEDTDLWLRLAVVGPFALLRRQTTLIGRSRGSLSSWAQQDGNARRLHRRSLQRLERELERAGDASGAAKVRGALAFLQVLERTDVDTGGSLAEDLAYVCRLLPELHDDWGLALYYLRGVCEGSGPAVELERLTTLADAWPDGSSRMILALRLFGASAAARARRPRTAAQQLAQIPPRQLLAQTSAAGARAMRLAGDGVMDRLMPRWRLSMERDRVEAVIRS